MDEVIGGVNPDRFEPGAEDVPQGTNIDDQGFVVKSPGPDAEDDWASSPEKAPKGAELNTEGHIVKLPGPDPEEALPPRGVEIVGENSKDVSVVLVSRALGYLAKLHRLFRGRIEALRLTLEENGNTTGESPQGQWRAATPPSRTMNRGVELMGASWGEEFLEGINATRGLYVANLSSESAGWNEAMASQVALRSLISGEQILGESVTGTAQVLFRVRSLQQEEPGLVLSRRPAIAGLMDFGLFACLNGPSIAKHNQENREENHQGLDVVLGGLTCALEAEIWRDIFEFTEDSLGLRAGTITASVELGSEEAVSQASSIGYILRNFVTGLQLDREAFLASGGSAEAAETALQTIVDLCGSTAITAIGPGNTPPSTGEPSKKAMKAAIEQKKAEIGKGYAAATRVDHPSLLGQVKAALSA